MALKYKIAIVVMRSQILHNAHVAVLKKAFELGEKVIIFIGSANSPRTIENPFTYNERYILICNVINSINERHNNCDIAPLNDYIYDDSKWKRQIDNVINSYADNSDSLVHDKDICLVGGSKGEWYIDLFPTLDHKPVLGLGGINATDLRKSYFLDDYNISNKYIKPLVPEATFNFLKEFRSSKWYGYITLEFDRIQTLNKDYGKGPFLTCDNVIVQGDKVLLIKRKNHPGKGLWAIPGGYFDDVKDNSWLEGCYRELKEETNLDISFERYKCLLHGQKIYDHRHRSLVARLITLACYVILPTTGKYSVVAADDASDVKWFYLSEVKDMANVMYDDHHSIIADLVGFK